MFQSYVDHLQTGDATKQPARATQKKFNDDSQGFKWGQSQYKELNIRKKQNNKVSKLRHRFQATESTSLDSKQYVELNRSVEPGKQHQSQYYQFGSRNFIQAASQQYLAPGSVYPNKGIPIEYQSLQSSTKDTSNHFRYGSLEQLPYATVKPTAVGNKSITSMDFDPQKESQNQRNYQLNYHKTCNKMQKNIQKSLMNVQKYENRNKRFMNQSVTNAHLNHQLARINSTKTIHSRKGSLPEISETKLHSDIVQQPYLNQDRSLLQHGGVSVQKFNARIPLHDGTSSSYNQFSLLSVPNDKLIMDNSKQILGRNGRLQFSGESDLDPRTGTHTLDTKLNNALSYVDFDLKDNVVIAASDRKIEEPKQGSMTELNSLFSSQVDLHAGSPLNANMLQRLLDLKDQKDDQREDSIVYQKIRYQLKLKEKNQKHQKKISKSTNLSKVEGTFETRINYEKAREYREFQKNETLNERIRERKFAEKADGLHQQLNHLQHMENQSLGITQNDSVEFPLHSQQITGRDYNKQGLDLKEALMKMGQQATHKKLGSQILKMDNLERAVIEQVDPEVLISESNRMSERRLFKELSSFEQSVATQPTKRASKIADIYQDTFKHHMDYYEGKKRDNRNLSTNLPTQASKELAYTLQSTVEEPTARSKYKSPKDSGRITNRARESIIDLEHLAKIADLDLETLQAAIEAGGSKVNTLEEYERLIKVGSDGKSLKHDKDLAQRILHHKKQNQLENIQNRQSIRLRRESTLQTVKESQIDQIRELLRIKQEFLDEIEKEKKIAKVQERMKSPEKQQSLDRKNILIRKRMLFKQYSVTLDEFVRDQQHGSVKSPSPYKINQRSSLKLKMSPSKLQNGSQFDRSPSKITGDHSSQLEDLDGDAAERKKLSTKRYLLNQQRKLERKNDNAYKRMLMVYSRADVRKNNLSSRLATKQHFNLRPSKFDNPYQNQYTKPQKKVLVEMFTGKDKEPAPVLGYYGTDLGNGNRELLQKKPEELEEQFYGGSGTNSNQSYSRAESRQSELYSAHNLLMAPPALFDQQDDKIEALEYNNSDLPEEYLLAKFSFTRDEADQFKKYKLSHRNKDDDRRNTGHHFNKADMFNATDSSFNQMLMSDKPDDDRAEGLDYILKDFQKKSQFLQVLKQSNKNQGREMQESKQVHDTFVKNATQFGDLPLPILLKIKKGIFFVPGLYVISEGMAIAIRESLPRLETLNDTRLEKAILQKNKMPDRILSQIFLGLRTRPELYSISTTLNEIGPLSSTQLACIIDRRNEEPEYDFIKSMPALQELKLINNKCDPKSMDRIIEAVIESTTIKKLALQQMNLSERQLRILFDFLKAATIADFDISWNKVPSSLLAALFQALEANLSLQSLNLGWIQMGAAMSGEALLEENFPKFANFLKENQKLLHLNMTSVSLPEEYMQELISGIKRSPSLHCVHLCGNIMSDETIEHLHRKLKPTFINDMVKNPERIKAKGRMVRKLQATIQREYSRKYERIYDSVLNKEYMMEWMGVQQEYQHAQYTEDNDTFVPLILSKQLGHPEIRNAKHWKISNECYMCDKWKYTMIFWDLKGSGRKFQIEDPLLEEMLQDMVQTSSTRLQEMKDQERFDDSAQVFISGSFTNWEPRRMMQIHQLCAYLEGKTDALEDPDRKPYYVDAVKVKWRSIIRRKAPYRGDDAQFIDFPPDDKFNLNKPPELDYDQLFVYVDFVKPGKHHYVVTYENSHVEPAPIIEEAETPKFDKRGFPIIRPPGYKKPEKKKFIPKVAKVALTSYHQFLGRAHLSDYNVNTKLNDFNALDRVFDKDNSVFKDWRLDRPKAIADGFVAEIELWKVPNFVKDEAEVELIIKHMAANSEFLKTLFVIRSSASYFPVIRWLSYAPMVSEWNLLDENFEMGAVDRTFIAVTKNMDKALQGTLPEKDMSRFQFYESLVRLANLKYKQNNLTETVYEGVKLLIDVLKKRYDNYIWMGWRQDLLWTLEMNDLYKTNLTALTKLWKYYFVVKKTKILYFEDAIEQFCHEVPLDLLPEQVGNCWGLSKMTVTNDIKLRKLYYEAPFVEYLEFFARVAELKFKDGPYKNAPLVEKVEMLMDIMFPLVNMKRKEVVIEVEYVSVSEEDLIEDRYFTFA